MARKKPDRCPVCGKPFAGRLRFGAAQFEIVINGVRQTFGRDSETFIHDNGRRCERDGAK